MHRLAIALVAVALLSTAGAAHAQPPLGPYIGAGVGSSNVTVEEDDDECCYYYEYHDYDYEEGEDAVIQEVKFLTSPAPRGQNFRDGGAMLLLEAIQLIPAALDLSDVNNATELEFLKLGGDLATFRAAARALAP